MTIQGFRFNVGETVRNVESNARGQIKARLMDRDEPVYKVNILPGGLYIETWRESVIARA
jgi:hypothetical protein